MIGLVCRNCTARTPVTVTDIVFTTLENGAMNKVCFKNDGLIDIEAAIVMGVNAKDGDNPIGFFGTGLKYAVSTLLRHGCDVVIWRGFERFVFGRETMATRGKQFDRVTMNGVGLGFTTAMGPSWTVEHALRELYSNAIDEGGTGDWNMEPEQNKTLIEVDGHLASVAWRDRLGTWLARPEVIADGTYLTVRPGSGIYCRGIRVAEKRTAFAYDLKQNVQLTEDRTLAQEWSTRFNIVYAIAELDDATIIARAITMEEHSWPWCASQFFSPSVKNWLLEYDDPEKLPKGLQDARTRLKGTAKLDELKPSQREMAMIEKAIEMLARMDVRVVHEVKIADIEGCLGSFQNGAIWIATRTFNQGQARVTSTILEEHLHGKLGIKDFSREMQDWLLDALVARLD